MTNLTSIEKIKREYATEDAQMITKNGFGAVADTKKGCLHMSFENGVYSVFCTKDLSEFQTPDVECLIEFIMDQYQVIDA
eukprot:SAG25_NODE_188_length_12354_cov_23.716116_16_plen_80_part_00